jgi:hypothetical protein
MEYLIILALQLCGIGLHVMQKVSVFDKQYPEKSIKEIMTVFWNEDWNTLAVSAIVLFLNLIAHYIVNTYAPQVNNFDNYILYAFGAALVFGYAGQRLVYKYLGSAENFLNKKVDEKLQ